MSRKNPDKEPEVETNSSPILTWGQVWSKPEFNKVPTETMFVLN